MKYNYDYWLSKNFKLGMQMLVLENIKRQKRLVNNSKKYSKEEKKLIMKGLDMAFDRTWAADIEKDLLLKNKIAKL
jgi:GTP cyclohydrolase II